MHNLATESNFARVRDHSAANRFDQRRFASPIVADDGEDLVRIEVEIGVVERGYAAVALDERAPGEDGFDAHLATLRFH